MEQTPLPPLVSDEQAFSDEAPFTRNIDSDHFKLNYLRDIYEADRAKTREVVQALVDGIETMRQGSFADAFIFASDADLDAHADRLLSLAKSQFNIEPTK